ncbi:amino acid adenylation domain-containing protein [Sphingomonas sp. LB2R24]|uniref:amino acid adenylation domain-containing protein n=1 Tax=Sphingomonas sorbitolis TaxID=3096165 RepID=UPI002FC7F78E
MEGTVTAPAPHADRLAAQANYWRDNLAGAPALLELPTDRPRPAKQDFTGSFLAVELNADLTADLRRLASQHDTTLFVTLLAAWATVLSRLSGQEDLVIGSPTANRGRHEVENLSGLFVNTLALRIDLSGDITVAEILRRTRATALAAQDCQDIPFEQVVEIAQPPRSLNRSPLFQVMFGWQGREDSTPSLPGPEVHYHPLMSNKVNFDLDLMLGERNGIISGSLGYATSLFNESTVERYRGYFIATLHAMVADPLQLALCIDLLPTDERTFLLDSLNQTDAPYPNQMCVHQLFEEQAARSPDAVALIYNGQTLSYGELNTRANQLARHLVTLGVRPDMRVAICVERSFEMVVGLFAILKAGGAYVPLDPDYPTDRLSYMLTDSNPQMVLSHGRAREALKHATNGLITPPPTIDISGDAYSWASQSSANLDPARLNLAPHHLAYVIYTSGSTGTPKGVMVEHESFVTTLAGIQVHLTLDAKDVMPCLASLAFDISLLELLLPLSNGAASQLLGSDIPKNIDILVEQTQRVTVFHAVPSLMKLWRKYLDVDAAAFYPHMRVILVGGEAVPFQLLNDLAVQFPGKKIIELYGPTEASIISTACVYDVTTERRSIGRPLPNTRIYLMDKHSQLVPLGAIGEIHIGGAGVARGYLDRPAVTAERFAPNPFVARDRLYRTGDLARYLPDGDIEFLGRNDYQVKLRGFRIELGEIEARLTQHPDVESAVVTASESADDEKRLVAYIVLQGPNTNKSEKTAELRAHLLSHLPDYMRPAAYVLLDNLPLTSNGKLDRKALPPPKFDAYVRQGYKPPRGETEQALASIWSELLGIKHISRHDNFFELGGHSLLAIKLLERLQAQNLVADVRAVFSEATLEEFATTLQRGRRLVTVPPNLITVDCKSLTPNLFPLIKITQREIDFIASHVPGGTSNIQDIYPLLPLQEGLLFHHILEQEGDPYLVWNMRSFPTRESIALYTLALNKVIDRHDILRTSIFWENISTPVQVVLRKTTLNPDIVVLDSESGEIADQLREMFNPRHYRLDIRQAPMLRIIAAHDPLNERWLLMELIHHIVDDGISLSVIDAEVRLHLEARSSELTPPIPFRTVVAHARLGVDEQEHEAFFSNMLGDVTDATIPFGLHDVHRSGSDALEHRSMVRSATSAKLRSHARALRVGPASLFHVAWAVVLARSCYRDDVVFGTVLLGRMQGLEGVDSTLGIFIDTLPIRIKLNGASVKDCIHATHKTLSELLHHQYASLPLAQRCSGIPAPAPLFTAILNYGQIKQISLPNATTPSKTGYIGGEYRTNYPIGLSVADHGGDFTMIAQVVGSLSPQRICMYMEEALAGLIDALEGDSEVLVQELKILPIDERTFLLDSLNQTDAPYPNQMCVHQLFEEQAARSPDAVALIYNGQTLSYGELNTRANQLARHLVTLGVRPDMRVAICVERSFEMVVGLFAILKAGGAYVPLDPDYPTDRLSYMLTDSNPQMVLSHGRAREALKHATNGLITPPPTIDISGDAYSWASQSSANLDPARLNLAPHHLAYVIYTSGSTGTPKGVMVEHRNVVSFITSAVAAYSLVKADVVLSFSSISFDAHVEDLIAPLINSCTTVIRGDKDALSSEEINSLINLYQISVVSLPTKIGCELGSEIDVGESLRLIIIGGDKLALGAFPTNHKRRYIVKNSYGPTETTVVATVGEIDLTDGPHIGRPLSNARIYLLDRHRQPVPLGAVGEIFIGGAGVARGYLNRPELTEERFVPSPFIKGDRLYRTGDLAQYLSNGNIVFVGRNDQQVKLRGFRIELGEIEARLTQHPDVESAVVQAREGAGGDMRLVAYIVATQPKAATKANARAEEVNNWTVLFDGASHTNNPDGRPDFTGWNSSYSGEAIAAGEMESWLGETVGRILACSPKKILEIGCGEGLVVQHLAPLCERYVGTDISSAALSKLRRWTGEDPVYKCLELVRGDAAGLPKYPRGEFDTIVLNSVAQYFPDKDYLIEVLEDCLRLTSDGGNIFLGDIRHLGLLKAFHSSTQLFKASDALTVRELRERTERAAGDDKELLIDPLFFYRLKDVFPRINHVKILIKRDPSDNELTRFRYDVIIHVGQTKMIVAEPDFQDVVANDLVSLESILSSTEATSLRLRNVPNSRISHDAELVRLLTEGDQKASVGEIRKVLHSLDLGAPDASIFWELGEAKGFQVCISYEPASNGELLEVFFTRFRLCEVCIPQTIPADEALVPLELYFNNPVSQLRKKDLPSVLRKFCGDLLPSYMLPAAYVVLDRLPLNMNGKLDRKALPAPEYDAYARRDYESPRGEVEHALAAIWSDLLGIEKISRHDDFFELGGHSLLAVRLISRIQASLGTSVLLTRLFAYPTLTGLAKVLAEDEDRKLSPILPIRRSGPSPLSFAQQRLWFLDQLEGSNATYNTSIALRFEGFLDIPAFQRSLNELYSRHQPLRSVVVAHMGKPEAEYLPSETGIPLSFSDLRRSQDAEIKLVQITQAEIQPPFDLTKGPLIRARLIRLDARLHVFILVMHHIVSDGWSMNVLMRELSFAYAALLDGQQPNLPPLPIQYSDYAVWQQEWLAGDRLAAQANYWRDNLAGAPALLELPTDRPRPAKQDFTGLFLAVELNADLTADLRRLARQHDTTLFVTLLAAWATVLSRLSGQEDLVIGSPTANRGRHEVENLVGLFVNTLALRIDLSGDITVAEILRRTRATALAAQDCQDIPFEQVVEIAQPPRSLDRSPLFQVMFGWQGREDSPPSLPGLEVHYHPLTSNKVNFDLDLMLGERNGIISGSLGYATSLFDESTVERYRGYFIATLRAMVAS